MLIDYTFDFLTDIESKFVSEHILTTPPVNFDILSTQLREQFCLIKICLLLALKWSKRMYMFSRVAPQIF